MNMFNLIIDTTLLPLLKQLQVIMDFSAVVDRARALHEQQGNPPPDTTETSAIPDSKHSSEQLLQEEVYGRICNSTDSNPPATLALPSSRKTGFVFGPDSISSVILRQNAYDALRSLGFDHDFIYNDVVVLKHTSWLVLYTPSAFPVANEPNNDGIFPTTPATWDGVIQIIKHLYPEAVEDVMSNLGELQTRDLDSFQIEAGFDFYDAKKNDKAQFPDAPPYFSYSYFCSLPKPRASWQVRAFLYCEMRLLKLFKGDGYTWTEGGGRGRKEYIAPNIPLSRLDPRQSVIIPMTVKVPNS